MATDRGAAGRTAPRTDRVRAALAAAKSAVHPAADLQFEAVRGAALVLRESVRDAHIHCSEEVNECAACLTLLATHLCGVGALRPGALRCQLAAMIEELRGICWHAACRANGAFARDSGQRYPRHGEEAMG